MTGCAAIHRDKKPGAGRRELADRVCVGPIAFGDPVRDVDVDSKPAPSQVLGQERGRACAVDIVIAKDGDALAASDRVRQAGRSGVHAGEAIGIGEQVAEFGCEEAGHSLDGDAPPCQHARHQVRHAVRLGDRCRDEAGDAVEALEPAAAADRPVDAVDRAGRREKHGSS